MYHQKLKSGHLLLMALAGLSSSIVISGNLNTSYVATLSGGPLWENAGETQTFYLAPGIEKTYAAANCTNALTEGELFLGLQKAFPDQIKGQIGLALDITSNAKLSGNIWDDADPQFNNYLYSYQIRHTHISLKGKLLVDRGYFVIPWISGSLGIGFNTAHQFSNTPTICEAVENPNFASSTKTAFSYTLGVGVQKSLTKNWQIGMGYEFADWGRSQLGRATGQTLNSGLALSHLYVNGILLNITYIG